MPRLPKDYSKGLIYKLCCKDTSITEIYVGSTTNFTQRKRTHKNTCNNSNPNGKGYNYKVYQFIRENYGWDNWDMVLIEYYPCETELELGRRENYWKQELQASLNTQTPHIYENMKEANKQYAQAHKKEKKNYQKEYYEANKEVIAEKQKKYQQANKEKISTRHKQIITCECGCDVSKVNMKRHKTSAKHLSILKQMCSGQDTPNSSYGTCV